MSKGIRQTIPAGAARAGVRPGTPTGRVPTATPGKVAAPASTDKRVVQVVQQGNIAVFKVKGHNAPIYALSEQQARDEAARRGVKGEPKYQGYVKLSESDRERLQQLEASRPRTMEDIRVRTAKKETARRMRKDEYAPSELIAREQASKEAAEKLKVDRGKAEVEAQREYIESKGGSIGVLSEAEAARADRTYTTLKRYEVSGGQYDITAALRDKAFTAAELRDMGFSQGAVSDATERVSASSYPESVGAKARAQAGQKRDTATAFAGSKGSAEAAGQDMTSVRPAPSTQKAGLIGNVLLLAFRNSDGSYNLQRMVESDLLSARNIRDAGFTDAQITAAIEAAQKASAVKGTQATVGGLTAFAGTGAQGGKGPSIATINPNKAEPTSTGLKAAATRNLLLRYQNKDASYDLQKAVEKGVSVKMLQTAGFSDAQIMAAINAAMKDLSTKQLREISEATGTEPRKAAHKPQSQDERVAALAKVMGQINTQVERDMAAQGARSRDIAREAERTKVAAPGEERRWYHWPTGQTVTDSEYRRATNNGSNAKAEEYSQSTPHARRTVIELFTPAVFSAGRAALPETKWSEITTEEKIVSFAQLAAWLAPAAPKGWAAGLQTGAGVVFGASTADNWTELSTAQKAVGVGASALLLTSGVSGLLQPSFKPVKVPLKDGGEAVVWSGLSVRGKPIVGVTKLPPNIKNVAEGWRPITKTETSIMGTRKMLAKMGVSDAEISKVLGTVKETKAFQPLRSPYEPKTVKVADVAPRALTPDELGMVLREAQKNAKNVEMVYGSTTIKPQLAPELRNWRQLGDIEIQLKAGVTEQQGAKLASDMVKALNQKNPGKFSIDPGDPKRILVGGHHAVELKLAEVSKLGVEAQYSLTRTGEMSWGMKVGQKPITVEYPGVGKLDIMRLSESGVRKADSITRAASGGKFAPPAHRVKDIADYYVILRTFKGADVADDWAKLYGYKPADLLTAAAKDPLKLEAWRFRPDTRTPGASPSIKIALPSSMAARVKASSPALYKTITSPVTSASLAARTSSSSAPSVAAYTTTAASDSASATAEEEESSAPSAPSPSEDTSSPSPVSPSPESPGSSPSLGGGGGGDTTVSTGGSSGGSTGGGSGGGGGTTPSTGGGGVVGGTVPEPTRRRKSVLLDSEAETEDSTGRVQWKQGAYWIMVEPPAKEGERQRNVQYSRRPFWGVRKITGSPEETFAKQGKPPKEFLYEMGVTKAKIFSYDKPHLRFRQTAKGRPRRRRGRVI